MVTGVDKGFERVLEINGIGYRAEVKGPYPGTQFRIFQSGQFRASQGVSASVDRNTVIKLACIDKEVLGQTAASIRKLRPPEPYKGKGIKYAEERIIRKGRQDRDQISGRYCGPSDNRETASKDVVIRSIL
jgi:large subunit ribosomal protein L6